MTASTAINDVQPHRVKLIHVGGAQERTYLKRKTSTFISERSVQFSNVVFKTVDAG